MEKLQILFPKPQLLKLRGLAKQQDRPVSELIRNAVELWLLVQDSHIAVANESPPIFNCGKVLAQSKDFRDLANDRTL